MAEIGTLGDIVFKVSANKVRTFDDLKIDSKTNYAKHTSILKSRYLSFNTMMQTRRALPFIYPHFLG